MIVRIVSYAAESVEEAEAWARENAAVLRQAEGVDHAYFFRRAQPAEAGAILLFASEDALRRYRQSDAYREAVDEIAETWGQTREPIREDVYELLDV